MRCFLLGITFIFQVNVWAGGMDGGGGGALVCRNPAGVIQSSELLDLWEARELGSQTIIKNSDPVDVQIERALAKLKEINPEAAKNVLADLVYIKKNTTNVSANVVILPPEDAKNNFSDALCPLEGMMYYDGLREKLLVKDEIFKALESNTDKAAAYIHESVYKFARANWFQDDSIWSRYLTGCLFSEETGACLGLKDLRAPDQFPQDREVWLCETLTKRDPEILDSGFYLYKNESQITGWAEDWTFVLKYHGAFNLKYELSIERLLYNKAANNKGYFEGEDGVYTPLFEDRLTPVELNYFLNGFSMIRKGPNTMILDTTYLLPRTSYQCKLI